MFVFWMQAPTAEIQIFEKEQEGHSNGFWKKTREVREEEEVWVVTCVRDVSKSPYNLPGSFLEKKKY